VTPPPDKVSDETAEQAILGAAILSPDDRRIILDQVSEQDLYHQRHRDILEAIRRLDQSGSDIDEITIADHLAADRDLTGYIHQLADATPLALHTASYVEIIHDKAAYRRRVRATASAAAAAERGEDEPSILRLIQGGLAGDHPGGSTDRYGVEPWSDFRDHTEPEIQWLVPGLIPRGSLVFLASPPKAGKTWLALALAAATATGSPYLSRFDASEPEPVVYLALEGQRSAIRARVGAITRGVGADPDRHDLDQLHISYKPRAIDLSDNAWASGLESLTKTLGASLVIVDVLRAAIPGMPEDGRGAEVFGIVRGYLDPILATGTSIVVLHHFAKSNAENRGTGNRMTGSGALFGAADVIIGIVTTDSDALHDAQTLGVDVDGRDVAGIEPFTVEMSGAQTSPYGGWGYADSIHMRVTDQPVKVRRPGGRKRKCDPLDMVQFIAGGNHGEVTAKQIRDEFDITDTTLRESYRPDLIRLGILYDQLAGTYRTPPKVSPKETRNLGVSVEDTRDPKENPFRGSLGLGSTATNLHDPKSESNGHVSLGLDDPTLAQLRRDSIEGPDTITDEVA